MHYKYLHKIDNLKVEIVYILVIITVVTKNDGNRRKSQDMAKNLGDHEFINYIHP